MDRNRKGYSYTLYGKTVTGTFEGYVSSPLYFFNNGTWSNLQTTGMTSTTLDSSNLILSAYQMGRLNQTVDLTSYKYLKVKGRCGSTPVNGYKFSIGASKSASAKETDMAKLNVLDTLSNGPEYNILDISSLSGNYYIYVYGVYYRSSSGNLGPDRGFIYEIFMTLA